MEIKSLDNLEIGQDAIIETIDTDDNALKCHLLDMGLTPNTEVTLIKKAPLGDPMEFHLRGYELTLRKDSASKIKIKDIHASDTKPRKNYGFHEIEHSKIGENNKRRQIIKEKVTFALIGNQNSGKTTLFNKLTGSNQHVGNFPGVTIQKTQGIIKQDKNATIVDLPGIYSLSPYSSEEIITRDFLLNEKPDGIINIVDATNIERNLFLTMQLIELDIPIVIALNMMDEVKDNQGSIDINGLEDTFKVPVVPISALKNEGLDELIEHAVNIAKYDERPKKLDFCKKDNSCAPMHRCIHSIMELIENHSQITNIPVRFAATKIAEGDKLILEKLKLDENEIKTINHLIAEMTQETGLDRYASICDMRYSFIEELCLSYVSKPQKNTNYKFSIGIDKILTGKYSAIPSFLIIISIILYITFGPVGTFLSEETEHLIHWITNIADTGLTNYGLNRVVHSLIIDGIFSGVGAVLSFLPVIVVLFFFLSILEDTGYMARVAFVMDKLLRKIGLSGRSFVPMLIGFGCSVPAIMATRTLPSQRDRKMTILLTPFMSCSAKLPIYVLFTSVFFKNHQLEVIAGLYLIGIITGIIFAYILKIFVFKGKPVPFVMELPNYRFPGLGNVYRLIYTKAKDFITKAFSVIFVATIIIWFFQTFDFKLNLATDTTNSILAGIGNLITPIFNPLGITDWRISTAFISGFMAKESVISTLSVLLDGDIEKLPSLFSNLSAFVFLVFSLLYTPCVAAIATVKKEMGKFWAAGVVLSQCLIAWFVAFIVYRILLLFT